MADNTTLGRAALELSVDRGTFFQDLDQAEAKVATLTGRFDAGGLTLKGLGSQSKETFGSLVKGAQDVDQGFGSIWTGLKGAAGLMGVTFGVGALVSFAEGLIASAGRVQDLSDKLSVSTDAVQRWEHAAKLTGGTIDQVSSAVLKASRGIAEGNDSFVAALQAAGLSLGDLRNQSPETAFEEMAEAVRGIQDPMEQARVATELFGRSGAELLPAIRAGFVDVGREAAVMSKDTIEALDMIGDAWTSTINYLKADAAEYLTKPFREWKDLIGAVKNDLTDLPAAVANLKTPDLFKNPETTFGATGKELDALMKAQQDMNRETEKAVQQWEAHNRKVQDAADILTGKALARKIVELDEALARAQQQGGLTTFQMARLSSELGKLQAEGATLSPRQRALIAEWTDMDLRLRTATTAAGMLTDSVKAQTAVVLEAVPPWGYFESEVLKVTGGDVLKGIKDLGTTAAELQAPPEKPWSEWQVDVTGTFGTLETNLGTTITALTKGWDEFWAGTKATAITFMDGIVQALEKEFVDPLIKKLVGSESAVGEAIANLFGTSAGAASAGSGAGAAASGSVMEAVGAGGTAAGASWTAAFLSSLTTAGLAVGIYGIVRSIIGYGESPERTTGISHEEYQRRYPNLYEPQDPGNPGASAPFVPQEDPGTMAPHDLFANPWDPAYQAAISGLTPAFAAGTPRLDFASFRRGGQLVTVHPDEAIIPRGGGHRLAAELANTETFGRMLEALTSIDRRLKQQDDTFALRLAGAAALAR